MENESSGNRKIRLRVMTPMSIVYDKYIDMVITRTAAGDMGILYGHEDSVAVLGEGLLRIISDSEEQQSEMLTVLGGILTVKDNDVSVMTETAAHPDNLQKVLAKLAEERAERVKQAREEDLKSQLMEESIKRALSHGGSRTHSMLKEIEQRQKEN